MESKQEIDIAGRRDLQLESIRTWYADRKKARNRICDGFELNEVLDAVRSGGLDPLLRRLPERIRIGCFHTDPILAIRGIVTSQERETLPGKWIFGTIQDSVANRIYYTFSQALDLCEEGVSLMSPGVWDAMAMVLDPYTGYEFEDTWLSPDVSNGTVNIAKCKLGNSFNRHCMAAELEQEIPTSEKVSPARFMMVYDPITRKFDPTPEWYADVKRV